MEALDEAFQSLRAVNQPVPIPMSLPTPAEVAAIEQELGLSFHPDYRRYLLEASDVVFGVYEPTTVADPESHTHLPRMLRDARLNGLDPSWVPLCWDNGDYFCIKPTGEVVYWSHGIATGEHWPNLAAWIQEVWLADV
jgi:hypothetical protein